MIHLIFKIFKAEKVFVMFYVIHTFKIALVKDLWGDVVVPRFCDYYDVIFRLHSVNKVSYFSAFKLDATKPNHILNRDV